MCSTVWGKSSGLHCWSSAPLCAYSWYCTRCMLVTTSWQSRQEPPVLPAYCVRLADGVERLQSLKKSQGLAASVRCPPLGVHLPKLHFEALKSMGIALKQVGHLSLIACRSRLVPPPPPPVPGADCFLKECLLWPVNLTVRQVCFCFLVQSWLSNGMGTDWSAEVAGFNQHRNNQHTRHTSLSCPVWCCQLAA